MENNNVTITLTAIANLLKASGVSAEDVLAEAGLTPKEAIDKLSAALNVEAPKAPEGAIEVTDEERKGGWG